MKINYLILFPTAAIFIASAVLFFSPHDRKRWAVPEPKITLPTTLSPESSEGVLIIAGQCNDELSIEISGDLETSRLPCNEGRFTKKLFFSERGGKTIVVTQFDEDGNHSRPVTIYFTISKPSWHSNPMLAEVESIPVVRSNYKGLNSILLNSQRARHKPRPAHK